MILFLDFDGVLHPFSPRRDISDEENQLFAYLPRLEATLRDFPHVRIVISSDWRQRMSLDDIRQYFSSDMRPRVIGVTPSFPLADDWIGCRHREALAWLTDTNQADVPWVALDDVRENWQPDAPLILCDDGFQVREEAALRCALSER